MTTEKDSRDAFDVKTDVFEGGWCACCPPVITMPVATMIAIVLGVLVGIGLYEADIQDKWMDCYSSSSGSSSTSYSLTACTANDDGCFSAGDVTVKIEKKASKSAPEEFSCWIELFEYPGKLWVRALKCLVSPLLACMMLLIPSKLKSLGSVGQKVAMLLLFTSFFAALEGLMWGNIFQPGSHIDDQEASKHGEANPAKDYVTELESFLNIGIKAVPVNIIDAMAGLRVLGIITFFLTFGYYLEIDCPDEWRRPILNSARGFLRATLNALMLIMWMMPVAMFSLLSYHTMKTDLSSVAGATGMYLACQLVGQFLHLTVFYFSFFFLMTKRNPAVFFYNISRAPFTALLTSSSAATLPVTLSVNRMERGDNKFAAQVVNFVCPLGAALNMDGTSLGFPVMVLFVSQIGEELDQFNMDGMSFGNMLLVALLSMVCSLGTAPIPNAGLVYLTMLMEAADIHDASLQGMGIAMIVLVDWIVDRVETAQNVTSDSFISAIIAYSEIGFFKGLANEAAMASNNTEMAERKGDQKL